MKDAEGSHQMISPSSSRHKAEPNDISLAGLNEQVRGGTSLNCLVFFQLCLTFALLP